MRAALIVLLFLILASCRTKTEKWLDGMADYKSIRTKDFTMEIMKIKAIKGDTTSLSWRVRLHPGKDWMENSNELARRQLLYTMDSCFTLHTAKAAYRPEMVQPVNSGVPGCFEYLLSFGITNGMKYRQLQMAYSDRAIDKKNHQVVLN
jgi:hypothetical protein